MIPIHATAAFISYQPENSQINSSYRELTLGEESAEKKPQLPSVITSEAMPWVLTAGTNRL